MTELLTLFNYMYIFSVGLGGWIICGLLGTAITYVFGKVLDMVEKLIMKLIVKCKRRKAVQEIK